MWNKATFTTKDQWVGTFSTSVLLKDVNSNTTWIVTGVYGPTNSRQRGLFWSELNSIRNKWSGYWCIHGDWNVVKFPSERSGCNFLTLEMTDFSDWIKQHLLWICSWVGLTSPSRITNALHLSRASTGFWCWGIGWTCFLKPTNLLFLNLHQITVLLCWIPSRRDGGLLRFDSNWCGLKRRSCMNWSEIGGKIAQWKADLGSFWHTNSNLWTWKLKSGPAVTLGR